MVDFNRITVNDQRTASITVDDVGGNLDDTNTNFERIQVILAALDPRGPNGPVDPDDGTSTGIPLKFLTQADENGIQRLVQADISSTTAFQQSLEGITINAGDGITASVSNSNAFGTSIGKGDVLFARVNNPTQDITNTTDWLRLEGDDSYSVTLSEHMLLNSINEQDTPVRIVDSGTETTITFYLLSTQASVDGDLTGGQTGSFTQTTDNRRAYLYVRVPSLYTSSQGVDNLYVEVTDPNGTVVSFQQLSTYKERDDLLVGGDDVYESDATGQSPATSIGYTANQIVRLWRVRLSREWYLNPGIFDFVRGIEDASIPIAKLGTNTQTLLRTLQEHAIDDEQLLQSVSSKVDTLFPLSTDVTILTDWADIYDPSRASEVVTIVPGYSLLADFRGTSASDHYESAGVTYTAGTNVSQYSGLTDDLHRSFGFRVSAAANQTLLSIGTGANAIPFIDITSGGNLRANNYTPARTQDEEVSNRVNLVRTPTTGSGTIAVGGAVSTYTAPGYPANTSNQSRTVGVDLGVLVSGSDTGAGGDIDFDIPDILVAQAKQTIDHTFNLGPLHGNRRPTCTIGYEVRVSGSDLLLDLSLEQADSDITLRINNVDFIQSYTATTTIARVDNFENFSDAGGDFTFSGDHEFLFAFHPYQDQGTMLVVPVAINTSTGATTQLNDIRVPIPSPGFDEVEAPDTIEFRTFLPNHFLNHSDLVTLLGDRTTKWAYALARLEETTGHAVTETIDLTAGSTIGGTGNPINSIPDPTLADAGEFLRVNAAGDDYEKVEMSRDITSTAIGGTGDSVLTLPSDYTNFELLSFIVLEDGAQTQHGTVSTRHLANEASISPFRIQGNDFANWVRTARTLTLDSTLDAWQVAVLCVPKF